MNPEANGIAFGYFSIQKTFKPVFQETTQKLVQVTQKFAKIGGFFRKRNEKLFFIQHADDKPSVHFFEQDFENQQETLSLGLCQIVWQIESVPDVPEPFVVHQQRICQVGNCVLLVFLADKEKVAFGNVVKGLYRFAQQLGKLKTNLFVLVKKLPVSLVNAYQFIEFGHAQR
jgi:hypothetical protein